MIKVKRCLFAFFCTSVLPPCTLPFLVQKLQLKNQKNCHAQMSDFSKLLLHPQVLIWLDLFKIIIETGDTKIPYCVILCDPTWPSFFLLLHFKVSYNFPRPSICPSDSIPHWHLSSLSSTLSLGKTGHTSQLQKTLQMFGKLIAWKAYTHFC